MKNGYGFARVACVAGCAFGIALAFISCGPNTNQIRRMQALETGVSSPTTIEELEAGIKKYQDRIEDVLNSDIRVGIWYKILATRYLDNKMYAKALENFRIATQYYPDNQNLYYYVGLCAGYISKSALDYELTGTDRARQAYLDLSESAYKRAIELEPRYFRALYGLGVLYVFERDEPEKAIPLLETAIDVEKRNTDAMFILARAYYSSGRYEEAVALYDRILSLTNSEERKKEAETNKAFVLENSYGKP